MFNVNLMTNMKKKSIITACAIALIAIIVGCSKVVLDYGDIQLLDSNQALLKVNYVSQYSNNRSVYFKVNDTRVSGLLTARTPFPGGGFNTGGGSTADFLQVPSGSIQFSVGMPHKVDNGTDSLILYTTTLQLTAGKYYSVHISDTAATTKNVLTEEIPVRPDTGFARFHFVNLMPNVPAIDLYYGATSSTAADQSTDSLLVGNVAFMSNSPDFLLRVTATNKIWKIRPAGSAKTAANVLAFYGVSTSVPTNQRVFTAFASGYSGKTNTQKPYISFFLVK